MSTCSSYLLNKIFFHCLRTLHLPVAYHVLLTVLLYLKVSNCVRLIEFAMKEDIEFAFVLATPLIATSHMTHTST